MTIPVARPFFDERERRAVEPVIESGWVSQGPRTAEFETRLAAWIGVKHAVATNSCTSAMQMALHLRGIGPGDEVLCPSFTCMATANAILQVGAQPRFVDIDPGTFNMDPAAIAAAITTRTRCVMVVHQVGLSADLDAIGKIARAANLVMIEDAGCALGAQYRGRRIGAGGIPACFSFHPRKTITTGEGGVLTTDDDDLAARARAYRSHGASVSTLERHQAGGLLYGHYYDVGHNFRFTDIQAAIGLVQLEKLDEILRLKTAIADQYSAALASIPHVVPPQVPADCRHAWQSYLVTLAPGCPVSRDGIIVGMGQRGVTCLRGIAPLHREPFFAGKHEPRGLRHSDDIYSRSVFLPIYAAMSDAEITYVMTAFGDVLSSAS